MSIRPRAKSPAVRDQTPTGFARVLEALIRQAPEILGAALVDEHGETVDFAGNLDAFAVRIAGAEMRLMLSLLTRGRLAGLGATQQLAVRANRQSFLVRALSDGYALVLVTQRRSFSISQRALSESARRLCEEAGWALPGDGPVWRTVDVETAPTDQCRPVGIRFGDGWQLLEVMGSIVGLGRHERGYRVRLGSGAELSLIREPLGRWYSDDLPSDRPDDPSVGGNFSTGSR